MGREELAALISILEAERDRGPSGHAIGTWKIGFDKNRGAFVFDKCENEGYCEERPSVIALDGTVLDAGGPLFG
jgi:hypothetical protein